MARQKRSFEVKPEIESIAKIKVIGIGGSGGSAINRMVQHGKIRGVEFIAINTDVQALQQSSAHKKVQIGKDTTRGLGAGMDPDVGARSAEEDEEAIKKHIADADMIFVTCGLGGGTGSGAAPIIADIARQSGALTVAVVTRPFNFEGMQRRAIADEAHDRLVDKVDTLITIPNDRLMQVIDKSTSLLEAFTIADDVLRQGVLGISELITVPGMVNVDFADVKSIMSEAGSSLMGIGVASGEGRAEAAARDAVESPLLEVSIEGARGILFVITAGPSLSMHEVNAAADVITSKCDPEAKIIFGTVIDEAMGDELKVTVIATGFTKNQVVGNEAPIKESYKTKEPEEEVPSERRLFTKQREAKQQKKQETDEEEKSELDIPAFIRNRMRK